MRGTLARRVESGECAVVDRSVLAQPTRYTICAKMRENGGSFGFTDLSLALGMTSGNLMWHLRVLVSSGLVRQVETYPPALWTPGQKPKATTYELTEDGEAGLWRSEWQWT